MEDVISKAKILIEDIPYITIASITPEGEPWNSPVFAVHDGQYNFFWNSAVNSQHSKNIINDSNIFIVIYNSSAKQGEGFGVYIQATAEEITEQQELQHALEFFYAKKDKPAPSVENFMGESLRRFYTATTKKCWVNAYDKNRMPPDYRQEIKLWI